ncbi:MAG: hypothetical protein EOR00_30565 [Mesorhizobium sp.]|uniref:hypothetical protein n=1 Tax=Mesorhizobium sp. TaxID=1871066 RepID=UPI000FE5E60A|nr:hypothetical protein [Mesorhizobium sp.]RWP10525.1 MAG: hypothetical protein EOR00_30565 [Mesorhizobium sp.]
MAMANANSLTDMLDTVSDSLGRAIPRDIKIHIVSSIRPKKSSADFNEKHWLGAKKSSGPIWRSREYGIHAVQPEARP